MPQRLAIQLAIGAAFGWMGPFGTFALPLQTRFLYWTISVLAIGLFARFAVRLVVGHGRSQGWPIPARVAAGAVLAGFPGSFITLLLQGALIDTPRLDPRTLFELYLTVTLLIGLLSFPRVVIAESQRASQATIPPAEPPAVEPASSFLRRIPARLGTELLSLSAEDHYIRVTTALGSELILCRLSDAIAELTPASGHRVHRSHWVAREAVFSVERKGGKTILTLINGDAVPVSQSYMPTLRAAGWL